MSLLGKLGRSTNDAGLEAEVNRLTIMLRERDKRLHDNEQKIERLDHQLTRERKINRATAKVGSSLDIREVLQLTLNSMAELLDVEAASIFLVSRDKSELVLEIATNLTITDDASRIRVPIGKGLAGTVAKTGELINIADAQSDPRFMGNKVDKKTGMVTRSVITVPIRSKGQLIGVAQAINKRHASRFDADDEKLFLEFTDHAGISLVNAELFSRITESEEHTRKQNQRLLVIAEAATQLGLAVESAGIHIEESVSVSGQAHKAAEMGAESVSAVAQEVDMISMHAASTLSIVERLNRLTDKINDALKSIDDISDRTNVLSINAAIEASRAGTYGRGFMVVVEEIRRLSARTQDATRDISQIMADIGGGAHEILNSMKSVTVEIDEGRQMAAQSATSLESIRRVSTRLQNSMGQLGRINGQLRDLAGKISRGADEIGA